MVSLDCRGEWSQSVKMGEFRVNLDVEHWLVLKTEKCKQFLLVFFVGKCLLRLIDLFVNVDTVVKLVWQSDFVTTRAKFVEFFQWNGPIFELFVVLAPLNISDKIKSDTIKIELNNSKAILLVNVNHFIVKKIRARNLNRSDLKCKKNAEQGVK